MAHALVFGASGISGWAILKESTTYPSPNTFARITGLSNRPLTLEQASLPQDPRLNLVNGVDLTKSVPEVVSMLREKVQDVETISHVFFTAYIHMDEFESSKQANTALVDTAIRAVEEVSPALQTVVLQTGGKWYGLNFPDKIAINPPLHEDLPRIPEPYASKLFYYSQYDVLAKLSQGKKWTFSEVRPDGIIGFTPTKNGMNLAQGIGMYLAMYREIHGAGAKAGWLGTENSWKCKHQDTSQDILAKMEIYAATHIEECGNGRAFNAADGKIVTWEEVWPKLCENFGLVGKGPTAGTLPVEEFVKSNRDAWERLTKKYGLKKEAAEEHNWQFVHFMLATFDFDRQFDLTKCREAGFKEEIDTAEGYINAWEKMRKAKILPPVDA